MIPETPGAIREVLLALGIRPRKRLGQNFLADPNLRDAIVNDAGVRPGDLVLEVGPGLGTLTKGLLGAGARVVAAELDAALADFLASEFEDRERFRIVRGDAIGRRGLSEGLLAALGAAREGTDRFLLVANLPYGISTPLLAEAAKLPAPPERIVVMVQREVADRMAGVPGTGDYGPLAVLLALRGEVRILRAVGGKVFHPPAPVRSAVVEVVRRDVDPLDLAAGDRAARLAFRWRRKTLRRALSVAGIEPERVEAALAAAGARPEDRPEVLSPEQFVALGLTIWPGAAPGPV